MLDILIQWIKTGNLTSSSTSLNLTEVLGVNSPEPLRLQSWDASTQRVLSRSLTIRHLDAGSSNAEEAEMLALSNPYYDFTRFGFEFTASPRHADILTVSGPVTRHLVTAMKRTYEAMPYPKLVVAIGDGACMGSLYQANYACLGRVDQFLPVDVAIPGDPPSPIEILAGLLRCKFILAQRKNP